MIYCIILKYDAFVEYNNIMILYLKIEKDWVIVVAEHLHEKSADDVIEDPVEIKKIKNSTLTSMNATVRRFDLLTAILAPLFAGVIMSFVKLSPSFDGIVTSAVLFAIWNLVSFFVEYGLLASVYRDIPHLKKAIKIYKPEDADADALGDKKKVKITSFYTILNYFRNVILL